MATIDRDRACLTCSCPSLRTYSSSDAYCSACGHPAAQHCALLDEQSIAPIPAPERIPIPLREPEPVPTALPEPISLPNALYGEKQPPNLSEDEGLESGWRAVLPSGLFFSIAIAAAGVGFIVAGLAIRFRELLAAAPLW